MLQKLWAKKSTRFLCVGVMNTLNDLLLLNFFVFVVGIPPVRANLISATISIIISYFLNHYLVFQHKDSHQLKRFLRFFAVTGLSVLLVQSAVIFTATYVLRHDAVLVQQILNSLGLTRITPEFINLNVAKAAAVLAGMVWNYLLYHLIVFKEPIRKVAVSSKEEEQDESI